MKMEKVANWKGMTQTHGFNVDVTRDEKTGVFVAHLHTYSSALAPESIPGQPTPMMDFDDPETIKHEELDELRELTKQQIAKRCGKILQFREKTL